MVTTTPRRPVNPDDPRIKRTLKLLGDALMELLQEKGYDAVTIQDITERADVSRTTFYLHFETIDDLLFARMRILYEELTHVTESLDWSDPAAVETALSDPIEFEHVQRYLAFYRVMLSDKGSIAFVWRVLDYLAHSVEKTLNMALPPDADPNIPLPIIAHISAGAEIAVIRWWIMQDLPYTPARMAQVLYQAQVNGLWWAMGTKS